VPEWLAVILLGMLEGITEFLPISSTGHLLVAEGWLGHRSDLFNTVIQCGAVLAVLLVFSSRVQQLCRRWREPQTRSYILKLMLAFILTCLGGLILKKLNFKLPERASPVAWATLIGGVLILLVEGLLKNKPLREDITWPVAMAVGLAQVAAACFPGLSRSGATILIALALGVDRRSATEFSFLLGIPTLLAAGALQIYSAYEKGEPHYWWMLLLGSLAAAITAFAAVKWLIRYVQHHTFVIFGWYRIAVGLAILILLR
jgi:undecaprenyl-diphosphatase